MKPKAESVFIGIGAGITSRSLERNRKSDIGQMVVHMWSYVGNGYIVKYFVTSLDMLCAGCFMST